MLVLSKADLMFSLLHRFPSSLTTGLMTEPALGTRTVFLVSDASEAADCYSQQNTWPCRLAVEPEEDPYRKAAIAGEGWVVRQGRSS